MKTHILLVALVLVHGVSGCVDLASVTQDGKRMMSSVFKKVDNVPLYTCVSHCLTVSTCKSVSYQRGTRTCHLASQDSAGDPGDVQTDPEFFLTDISLWPQSLAGPCEGVICTGGNSCVVDRFNTPSCVTEHVGCGPAPDLANANKFSTGQYEGAVTQYTCQSEFLFCGTSSTHTCSSLGTWEGLNGTCNQAVWYNPTLIFAESTTCPMSPDYHIVVYATPLLAATRMVVALKTAADVTLQMDIRFNYGAVVNETWFNRKINDIWSRETVTSIPFVVSQPFVADIRRQNSRYEVFIDGTYYGGIGDITPDEHPDNLVLHGDMSVSKFEFLPV